MRDSKAVKIAKAHNEILRKHLNKVDLTIQVNEPRRMFLEYLNNG